MKIRRRLKSPARLTSYKPPSRIIMSVTQVNLLKRLNIPLEAYAKEIHKRQQYKRRYA